MSPADLGFPLSRAERSTLRACETDLHRRGWAHFVTTARELQGWMDLAVEVDGYRGTPDDYTNDLCSRDALELILEGCPTGLASKIRDRLRLADDDFLARTVPDDDHLLGRFYRVEPDAGWWWRRIPGSGSLATALGVSK